MATKPVKVLTDLLTKKQIIKRDTSDNLLFQVSGTISAGHVSSSLPIFGSSVYTPNLNTKTTESFINLNIVTSSQGQYNIDQAFHAVDTSFNNSSDAYKRLRYQLTGNFDTEGYAQVQLPAVQYGKSAFNIDSFNFININVTVKEDGNWVNDLIAVNLVQSGSLNDEVWVKIYAPALSTGDLYKLIAVNENPESYVL